MDKNINDHSNEYTYRIKYAKKEMYNGYTKFSLRPFSTVIFCGKVKGNEKKDIQKKRR